MKVYIGVRSSRGPEVFVVDNAPQGITNKPLKHFEYHSPDGFEWGYAGPGPSDLALAILADHFKETPTREEIYKRANELRCLRYYHRLKWDYLMEFNREGFTLPEDILQAWIERKEKEDEQHGKKREP